MPDPDASLMLALGFVSAARLASLATGRGGLPTGLEWPIVLGLVMLIGVLGSRMLSGFGLTRLESASVAVLSPALVLVDAPLGNLAPRVGLAANLAGCLIPCGIGAKILIQRGRAPFAEAMFLLGVGVLISYFSSHVDPARGVLLQYRLPAVLVGLLAAALLYREPEAAGAAGFAAGALGVLIGADVLHLEELATSAGSGRVILGGAGLLDGILLVAFLAAGIAAIIAFGLNFALSISGRSQPTA